MFVVSLCYVWYGNKLYHLLYPPMCVLLRCDKKYIFFSNNRHETRFFAVGGGLDRPSPSLTSRIVDPMYRIFPNKFCPQRQEDGLEFGIPFIMINMVYAFEIANFLQKKSEKLDEFAKKTLLKVTSKESSSFLLSVCQIRKQSIESVPRYPQLSRPL